MRENEPVMLVLSVCDGEILLEKGEMLSEKRQRITPSAFEREMIFAISGATRSYRSRKFWL